MPTNEEKLILLMEGQNKDVLRKLKQIERQTKRSFNNARSPLKKFNSDLKQSAVAAKSLATALVAGLGGTVLTGGALAALSAAANDIAEIGSAAKRAGLDIKSFQELSFVAEQNRISIDALTDGMKELSLRADEFIDTGNGSAAEAFQRLGFTAEELREQLQKPSDLLVEIIERLQRFDRAAQIRIADEVFGGTGGERFVELLDQGADSIRDMIKQANELGIVLDEKVVRKAEEIDRRFNTITTTVSTKLKTAIISAADELAHFLELLNTVDRRSDQAIRDQIADKRQAIEDARGKSLLGFGSETYIGNLEREIERLEKQLAKNALSRGYTSVPFYSDLRNPVKRQSTAELEELERARERAVWEAERQEQATKRVIEALQLEQAQIGKTSTEIRIMNELQRAGVAADSERGQEIAALVEQIEQARAAQAAFNDVAEFAAGHLQGVFSGLISGAEDFDDSMKRVIQSIADAALQAALLGQGPLASLFGGGGGGIVGAIGKLFGFQSGGYTGSGAANQIAGVVHRDEFVFSKQATRALGVNNLEQLHRLAKGFSGGGFTGGVPSFVAPAVNDHARSGLMRVSVGVSVDNDGNLQAYVRGVSQRESASAVSSGLSEYDRRVAPQTAKTAVLRGMRTDTRFR